MPAITAKFLEPYLTGKVRHPYYKDSVEMADEIRIHSDGEYPVELIEERRPAELEQTKAYRKKIWQPITKPVFNKVYNALMKIRKSGDMVINFPQDRPSTIPEDESPETYLKTRFPKQDSLMNWMFSIAFKPYLVDANALVFTIPIQFDVPENEYVKPYPRVFTSSQVIDYKDSIYIVLEDCDPVHYETEGNYYTDGKRYWVVQPDLIQVFDVAGTKVTEVMQVENPLGYIPIRWMYGQNVSMSADRMLNESRISGIIPRLNEAVREYSDLQAEVVQHIHTTYWTLQPQACQTCRGKGNIPRENSAPISCPDCQGKGLMPFNPYEHLVVGQPRPGEPAMPTPPAGQIEKNTSIATLQDARIAQHIYAALSAINMEYLAEVPIEQSGVAKQVDREELDSFVHSIAEDVVRIMDGVARDCMAWRHIGENIDDLIPSIPVPERFDMVTGNALIDELQRLSEAKVDPAIINAAQIDLINKKFSDETAKQAIILQLRLDPFAGVSVDELAAAKTFDAITQEDFVIHNNITKFIHRALEEVDGFPDMNYTEQMQILAGFATEQITPDATAQA